MTETNKRLTFVTRVTIPNIKYTSETIAWILQPWNIRRLTNNYVVSIIYCEQFKDKGQPCYWNKQKLDFCYYSDYTLH